MVDFGFGSFIEKFEDYFGRSVTKTILAILGFGVVVIVLGAVWEVLAPLFNWATNTATGSSATYLAYRIVLIVAAIGFLVSTAANFAQMIEYRGRIRSFFVELDSFAEAMDQAAWFTDESKAIMQDAKVLLEEEKAALIGDRTDDKIAELDSAIESSGRTSQEMREMAEKVRSLARKTLVP